MNTSRQSALGLFPDGPTPRLYDGVVDVLATRHYSRRTEEAYVHWIRRFILFHKRSHRRELRESDVNRFPTHLAVKETGRLPLRTRRWRRCCSFTSGCWSSRSKSTWRAYGSDTKPI